MAYASCKLLSQNVLGQPVLDEVSSLADKRRAKIQPKRTDHTVSLLAAATSDHKSLERQKSCFGLWRHSSLAQLVDIV